MFWGSGHLRVITLLCNQVAYSLYQPMKLFLLVIRSASTSVAALGLSKPMACPGIKSGASPIAATRIPSKLKSMNLKYRRNLNLSAAALVSDFGISALPLMACPSIQARPSGSRAGAAQNGVMKLFQGQCGSALMKTTPMFNQPALTIIMDCPGDC